MKISHTFFSALLSIIFIVVLQGCIKDTCTRSYSYTWFEPLYKTTTAVRENIKTQPATAIRAIGKLFVKDKYIFLNEINKGIHIIDNTNPAVPVNIGFIEVPGNIDIAVK